MPGHGGPNVYLGEVLRPRANCRRLWLTVLFLAGVWACGRSEASPNQLAGFRRITVRITWWSSRPGKWSGAIVLSAGEILSYQSLSIEPDAAASVWSPPREIPHFEPPPFPGAVGTSGASLLFDPWLPRRFDGVEMLVATPPDALLAVGFRSDASSQNHTWITIPVAELGENPRDFSLDGSGLVVRIHRRADDRLRVSVDRDNLVFRPGESFRFELHPDLPRREGEGSIRLDLRLTNVHTGRDEWRQELELAPATEVLPFSVRLPHDEAVYELVITAETAPRLALPPLRGLPTRPPIPSLHALPEPPWAKTVLATRKIQLVVLKDHEPLDQPSTSSWRQLAFLEPGSNRWRERFNPLPQPQRLLPLTRTIVGSRGLRTIRQAERLWAELEPSVSSDPTYLAVTIPVEKQGVPHRVDIELLPDFPQLLTIGVLEPAGGDGAYWPSVFSAVVVPQQLWSVGRSSEPERHHLVFWPRSKEPVLVLVNLCSYRPARWGRITVHSFPGRLPVPAADRTTTWPRMLTAYAARPFSSEMFGGTQKLSSGNAYGADDWLSFYEAATRVIDYVRYLGYNAVSFPVYAEGSGLYPSEILRPSCRYDTGLLVDGGEDPVRKDIVELFMRLCDRAGLGFVPALEFAAPLPGLELSARTDPAASSAMMLTGLLVGPGGDVAAPVPRYNPLHPQVQEAIERAIIELVDRYGKHPCFRGVAVQLTPETFTHFPGIAWPLDDRTVAQFCEETGASVELTKLGSSERALVLSRELRPQWLAWRARKLTEFYLRLGKKVATCSPQAVLFLVGPEIFDVPELRYWLRPRLPQQLTIADAYLLVGLDLALLSQEDHVVLLRPQTSFVALDGGVEIGSCDVTLLPNYDRAFASCRRRGAVIFRRPISFALPGVEGLSVRISPSPQVLDWHAAGVNSCRQLSQCLAGLDPEIIFDGTWQFVLGYDDSFRRQATAVKQLPVSPAGRLENSRGEDVAGPLVIRTYRSEHTGVLSVVNPTAIPLELRVRLGAGMQPPVRATPEGVNYTVHAGAPGPGLVLRLTGYGWGAFEFPSRRVDISSAEIGWPAGVREQLALEIQQLSTALAVLRNPPLWPALQNPGFEIPGDLQKVPPGWLLVGPPEATPELDAQIKRSGNYSLRLRSPKPGATLVSHPFDPPRTGRMTVRVHWRSSQQPVRLRLSVEGRTLAGNVLVLAETIAVPAPAEARTSQLGDFQFVDLEASEISVADLQAVRLRLDLLDPGEIWVDDVLLSQLAFNRVELVELMKLVAPAETQVAQGRYAEPIRLLESPWARFLKQHVLSATTEGLSPPVAVIAESPNPPAEATGSSSTGPLGRLWEWIPKRLRVF